MEKVLKSKISKTYNDFGDISSRLNMTGDFDEFKYNENGVLVASFNSNRGPREYTYNDAGLMLSYIDSNGYIKEYEYDEIGNCVEECLYKIDEDEHSLELFDVLVK